ncbi:MAG: dihydroorotate dehydrogenase electron transfer subunit [Gammaproteobacteria bacterium]|nr:dihydroorotate dehydrogenase electron transfer subunit [Gammaproteobacteria bacterium]NNF61021.1 dihydroorotate dehydrogenase electron transfer subunit [Gammaproteobacteria bacterium]NNM21891.1 dihydroorotate dehydrogenase electron transfer subunit [Gammaproteobacteria bacterium]
MHSPAHRGTIFVEDAAVVSQQEYPGSQYVLRLQAAKCAAAAQPGSFAHITCDPAVPMRRPLSIMRANADEGWVEFLYKIVGEGLRHLASRRPGDTLNIMGPIGQPFRPDPARPRPVLIGGGVGIPPMVFLAEWLKDDKRHWQPMVFIGSEIPFPFRSRPSKILVPGIPDGAIGCMPLLDDWGVPSRLASGSGYAGCYEGFVTDLARSWLQSLDAKTRADVEIFACGPTPMLRATAKVAAELQLPCQVSLEEYMACAVGGCAGCVVEVRTPDGPAMKRVCVDGPVFDAATVF